MDTLIHFDKQLLLFLNGSDCVWLDNVMWQISRTGTWTVMACVLLLLVWKGRDWRGLLLFVVCMALAITLADQISSSIFKPLVARPRPTHDAEIGGLVDVVRDYRGGRYGFVSSHAANVFAVATLVAGIVRRRLLTVCLLLWAALVSYSRIYLGVHYPGDILCGAALGAVIGLLVCRLYVRFVPSTTPFPSRYVNVFVASELLTLLVVAVLGIW